MNYRELQQKLREYRDQGLTEIPLNTSREALESELNRIEEEIGKIVESQVAKTPTEATETTAAQEVDTVASFKPKSLRLVVSQKWFKMIASGEKKEEYRAIKPYYESRFKKKYTYIKFELGYEKNPPTIIVELLGIEKGVPKPEWSDPELFALNQEVFILKLGEIVDVNFAAKALNAKPVEWVRDYQDDLQGNYRIDESEEDEDGELWLERLNDSGEPTEDYVSVTDAQMEYLKANGQIWEHNIKLERWVKPIFNKIHKFVLAVERDELSEDQLQAISYSVVFAQSQAITIAEALAKTDRFQLFKPNNLIGWGFDELVPNRQIVSDFQQLMAQSKSQLIAS